MLFNFWRPYPFFKPKNEGFYLCSIRDADDPKREYVMDLYFRFIRDRGGVWCDTRRQQVFNGYKVYKSGREPLEYNRVFTDSLCERLDVVAWKKIPRVYQFGKKKGA